MVKNTNFRSQSAPCFWVSPHFLVDNLNCLVAKQKLNKPPCSGELLHWFASRVLWLQPWVQLETSIKPPWPVIPFGVSSYFEVNDMRVCRMFLRYVLAFGTRVLKTCVPERAFWRILFSNNLWFIKFTIVTLQQGFQVGLVSGLLSNHPNMTQPSEYMRHWNPILTVHFRGVFPMALGEISFSQTRLGLKPIFAHKKGLRAPTGSNGGWSHQEFVKNIFVM